MERYLVQRSQRGDRHAFAELAAAIGDRLYGVAHRIMRDPEVAGDMAQQTLVKIWRDLPTLRDIDRFDAWSYRLLVNACRDEMRRQRGSRNHLQLVDQDSPIPDVSLSIADRDQLDRGFRHLSPEHRTVIILQYYLDYSTAEISTMTPSSMRVGRVPSVRRCTLASTCGESARWSWRPAAMATSARMISAPWRRR